MSFELPRADKPEDVGLSSDRLQRLTDTLKSDIDKGIVPGAVALIARRGKIAYETHLVIVTAKPAPRWKSTRSSVSRR